MVSSEQKPDRTSPDGPEVSVVVPVYNERDSVAELHERIAAAMNPTARSWELVLVDDGSTDGTREQAGQLADRDGHVVVVELARNFGQTAALAAGFDAARGSIVVSMDGDLQHDPAEIPSFLDAIDDGCDLVSGWRERRADADGPIRTVPSRAANWLIARICGVRLHDFGTTFKAYRRELLDGLRLYGDMHRFIPAAAADRGARIREVPIRSLPRRHGRSNYGLGRTFGVLLDLIALQFFLRYLSRPLRFFGKLGLACWLAAAALGGYVLWDKLHYNMPIVVEHGPLGAAALLLVLVGTIFISTGLIGEMLVRIYYEGTGRKTYVVRRVRRGRPPGAAAEPGHGPVRHETIR